MNTKRLLVLAGTVLSGLTLVSMWLFFLSEPPKFAHAASLTVCPSGCDYNVIQDAVDAAGAGDVIKVAAGTYTSINDRGGLAQVVYVDKSITISGGYTTSFSEPPDPVANPTTLDAEGRGRVFFITGDINPTIAGLRITGGEAKDLGSPIGIDAGGGVMVISATATLKDNYIYENSADSTHNGDGGGVYLFSSDATLENNTIISNTAEREGGGVRTEYSLATLIGNTISQNHSDRGQGAGLYLGFSPAMVEGNTISENYGVGLWGDHAAANITNNTIISNSGSGIFLWECDNARVIANNISYNAAGGVQSWGDNILISGNTISHNTAEWGGGISFEDKVTYIGNTISFNSATRGGGGLFGDGDVTLISNSFISNTAEMGGGLLIPDATDVQIIGNTFSGNYASSQGGGLDLWGGNPILTNNLIVDNHSDGTGSALNLRDTSSRLLHNTIARNSGSGSGINIDIYLGSSTITLTNNIIVSHTVGLNAIGGASVSLEATLWGAGEWANGTDWEGPGTIATTGDLWGNPDFVDYLAGDYHIGENSDAINMGIVAGVTTDIDNHPRPYQIPDIGADEYWPSGVLKYIYLPLVMR